MPVENAPQNAREKGKKALLLQVARSLFYRQGFQNTSLACIARESGISLGNLYYYYKTKDEILSAVIEYRTKSFYSLAADWEQDPDPRNRLISFIEYTVDRRDRTAIYGCRYGSLAHELSKNIDSSLDDSHNPLKCHVDWVTEQFKLMGKQDADVLGRQFVARLQGACLLTTTYSDSKILLEQGGRLKDWVKSF